MNKNKTIETTIEKTTLLSSTFIILIVATILGFLLINNEYENFKSHIKNFEKTLIERKKFNLKTSVKNIKNEIIYEKQSILENKKQKIKNQSIIAYNLALSLLNKTKNLSKEEKISLITSSIRQISQNKNDINYFILNKFGKLLLSTSSSENENTNFLDIEDLNGFKFVDKIINSNQNTQNYIEYSWYSPYKKITYSRHLKELGLIIGSHSFSEAKNAQLERKIINKIYLQDYNKEEYVLIYKILGLNNIPKNNNLLIEKQIISSKDELKAIEKLLISTNYKANGFISYQNDEKLIYGTFLEKEKYLIIVGVNLSYIKQIVKREKEVSLKNMKNKIIEFIIIITFVTLVFFIFSLLFTKKIQRLFKQYRKLVKQNEEKYALLFNHSNDGFIISEIVKNSISSILSLNSTALKITGYEAKDILYQDFFKLFENLELEEILNSASLFKTVKLKDCKNKIKTIELNIIMYSYENKNLIFSSLRDISERTLLKEEKVKQENILIQKSKMAAMGEMIGNIAHQWRQPLSQISGLFLDIESAYEYKELDKNYLEKRINEANDLLEYMSKTIDDFRNFFNPKSIKEEFYIKDCIQGALKIIDSTLKFHHINLEVSYSSTNKIYGFKNEYSQAILNIISNAKDILIDRQIKNPLIKIYTKQKNNKLTLYIEDNAKGIDDKIINKIFDPYFTTKYEYGTGIGLYMTKLIIEEKMNGKINVKNSKNGAIFELSV